MMAVRAEPLMVAVPVAASMAGLSAAAPNAVLPKVSYPRGFSGHVGPARAPQDGAEAASKKVEKMELVDRKSPLLRVPMALHLYWDLERPPRAV